METLHGSTSKETIIQVPQPKNLIKKEVIKVETKSPVVTEIVKRGRGRPPKAVSDKIISKVSTKVSTKKLATRSIKKVPNKSKEKK
jgi:hypothetical protein